MVVCPLIALPAAPGRYRPTLRAEDALNAVVMKELARFDEWREALTGLASQLRSWQNAAKATAIRDSLAQATADD